MTKRGQPKINHIFFVTIRSTNLHFRPFFVLIQNPSKMKPLALQLHQPLVYIMAVDASCRLFDQVTSRYNPSTPSAPCRYTEYCTFYFQLNFPLVRNIRTGWPNLNEFHVFKFTPDAMLLPFPHKKAFVLLNRIMFEHSYKFTLSLSLSSSRSLTPLAPVKTLQTTVCWQL